MRKTGLACLALLIVLAAVCLPAAKADAADSYERKCSICGKNTTFIFSEWKIYEDRHVPVHVCSECKTMYVVGTSKKEKHYGGTATCTEKAKCTACGHLYGDYGHDIVHHDAQAATCTEVGWDAYDTCTKCTYTTYKEIPALNHDPVSHDAQAATCTEIGWDAYETCTRCPYTTYKEIPALGHDWHSQKTVKPTCEADGYTLYACSRCPETDTRSMAKKLGHWFGEWTPNGNEAHTAECRRSNCSHAAAVGCERYEYTVNGESLTLCPVCGEAENAERLEWLEGASASAFDDSLPEGELVARRNASCLSLVFEYAGKVIEFEGEITFTLPAEALNGASLVLVSPDGTETPLSLKEENGAVSFTLDFTGMALLRLVFEA